MNANTLIRQDSENNPDNGPTNDALICCPELQRVEKWHVDDDERLQEDIRINVTWCNLELSHNQFDQ